MNQAPGTANTAAGAFWNIQGTSTADRTRVFQMVRIPYAGAPEGEVYAPPYRLRIYLEDKNEKSAYIIKRFSETGIAADGIF